VLGSQQGEALFGASALLAFGCAHLLEPEVLTTRTSSPGAATMHQEFPQAALISNVLCCGQADPENGSVSFQSLEA